MSINDGANKFYNLKMGNITQEVTGTFTATGSSDSIEFVGELHVLISGGAGTVVIKKSWDSGSSWYAVSKNADGDDAEYTTASDVAFNGMVEEHEGRVLYKLECTAFTSGTITYRMSQ